MKTTLFKNGKGRTREVQRIVAENFIDNPNNLQQVNHIDGNKKNNRVDNLEWCTPKENTQHSIKVLGNIRERKILEFDLNGNYIRSYKSITEAGTLNNIRPSSISNVLNGNRKKCYNSVWKYEVS